MATADVPPAAAPPKAPKSFQESASGVPTRGHRVRLLGYRAGVGPTPNSSTSRRGSSSLTRSGPAHRVGRAGGVCFASPRTRAFTAAMQKSPRAVARLRTSPDALAGDDAGHPCANLDDDPEKPMIDVARDETDANRQTIRTAFEAWKDGTGAITDVFAPNMVWRIEGPPPRSTRTHSSSSMRSSPRSVPASVLESHFDRHNPLGPRRRRHRYCPLGRARGRQRRPTVREQVRMVHEAV
jgi:hypothetical protein